MRIFEAGLLLFLAGCSSANPVSVNSATPVASEAIPRDGVEELAIAAVHDYFAVSSQIASDGGAHPERIAAVVTPDWLPEELTGFHTLRALGSRQVGSPEVTRIEVAALRGIAAVSEVVVHACTALDGVTMTNVDGDESELPTGVSLVTVYLTPDDGVLKVDAVEPQMDVSWCVGS